MTHRIRTIEDVNAEIADYIAAHSTVGVYAAEYLGWFAPNGPDEANVIHGEIPARLSKTGCPVPFIFAGPSANVSVFWNGRIHIVYTDVDDAHMAALIELMDDDIRAELHDELAPCTNGEFLAAYAEADHDGFVAMWFS